MKKILILLCIFSAPYVASQNLVRLPELATTTTDEKLAKDLTLAELEKRGLKPSEFYVEVVQTPETIELQLSHQDDFLPKNRNVVGNPSGKSQVCEYSKVKKVLNSCLYYQ